MLISRDILQSSVSTKKNLGKQFSLTNEITGHTDRILWPNLEAEPLDFLFYKGIADALSTFFNNKKAQLYQKDSFAKTNVLFLPISLRYSKSTVCQYDDDAVQIWKGRAP